MIAQACVGHSVHVCSFNWHKNSYLHDGIQHKILIEADIKAEDSFSNKLFNTFIAQGFPAIKQNQSTHCTRLLERRRRHNRKALWK